MLRAIEAWMHKPGQAAYPRTRVRGRGACEEAHGDRLSAHLGQLDRLCREFGSAIVAVLAIIADAEQYFSTDSTMARPTFSGASGLGVGAP